MDCPKIVTKVKMITGIACSYNITGSINIPTETKKIAPNKSFTGLTKCSICSACVVSAIIEPIIKAPNAGEKPTFDANITIIKHKASEIIKSISSVSKSFAFFNNDGMKKIPPINQAVKKNTSFKTDMINSVPENFWLTATVDNSTIIKMATMSCTIRDPITIPANFLAFTPSSSKVFNIIVVEDMDRITPRKMESIWLQPIHLPTKNPIKTMEIIWVTAVMEAVPPTFINFLKLNSSPKLNNKIITPISAQTSTLLMSLTDGKKSKCVPAKKPAIR